MHANNKILSNLFWIFCWKCQFLSNFWPKKRSKMMKKFKIISKFPNNQKDIVLGSLLIPHMPYFNFFFVNVNFWKIFWGKKRSKIIIFFKILSKFPNNQKDIVLRSLMIPHMPYFEFFFENINFWGFFWAKKRSKMIFWAKKRSFFYVFLNPLKVS